MMLLSLIGASRRSAWWVVAVVPFESSSLSQLVQSSMGFRKAPVRISVFWIFSQDHNVAYSPQEHTQF